MKGDFSRVTFDPAEHYTRVLLQQGRVSLDADFNEQASILLHRLRTFTADLLGTDSYSGAGPSGHLGFQIGASSTTGDFTVGAGRYYVNGLLVENETPCSFLTQPDYTVPITKRLTGVTNTFLAYLDVWERHVTCNEAPDLREVALGGPDTASRAKLVWQVKLFAMPASTGNTDKKSAMVPLDFKSSAMKAVAAMQAGTSAKTAGKTGTNTASPAVNLSDFPLPFGFEALRARAKQDPPDTDPCSIPPANSYRGRENQLYRVEVHKGGLITDNPTFKWSRENGSVIFPILKIQPDATSSTTRVSLATLGRDKKLGLSVGDWVEIIDDDSALQNLAEPLLQVVTISPEDLSVTLSGLRATADRGDHPELHPLLRRWDQRGSASNLSNGTIAITEGDAGTDSNWITLEDGIQILFDPSATALKTSYYRTGDYWLIPARTATGDVEWPVDNAGLAKALPPMGVEHQFGPLALISVSNGSVSVVKDLRHSFDVISKPMP